MSAEFVETCTFPNRILSVKTRWACAPINFFPFERRFRTPNSLTIKTLVSLHMSIHTSMSHFYVCNTKFL